MRKSRSALDEESRADSYSNRIPQGVDEAVVLAKINRHLLPLFCTLAMLCYLDRVNLAFAARQLNDDLGFSKRVYGLGSGIFFLGYAVLQVPSNLILLRVGAPIWLGVTVVGWGTVAALFATIKSTRQFYVLRFLLGITECGAFPGIWYHMNQFYSERELSVSYTWVSTAATFAQVLGAPLAAALLSLDGCLGLRGWQWLFLMEGLPTVAFGFLLKSQLAESPRTASFLTPAERQWLQDRQDAARKGTQDKGADAPAMSVMCNWRVWYLGLVWAFMAMSTNAIIFWAPLIIDSTLNGDEALAIAADKAAGVPHVTGSSQYHDRQVALLSAVPFAAAGAAMVINARMSKAAGERRLHIVVPVVWGAAGLMCALTKDAEIKGPKKSSE